MSEAKTVKTKILGVFESSEDPEDIAYWKAFSYSHLVKRLERLRLFDEVLTLVYREILERSDSIEMVKDNLDNLMYQVRDMRYTYAAERFRRDFI